MFQKWGKSFHNWQNPQFLPNKPKCFQNTIGFSTGLSDFHKLVGTSFKINFSKSKPIARTYRDMKHFDKQAFRSDLISEISKIGSDYNEFDDTFNKVLDKHAPTKTKLLRANHKPYVTKAMRKPIMKRSELASKYRL